MSQLTTAASRHHPRSAGPGESPGSAGSTGSVGSIVPGVPVPSTDQISSAPVVPPSHQLWWDRLAQDERSHTIACVEADDVDPQMLEILRCNGPVGPYGVRWAGGEATFMTGSFLDFVRTRASSGAPAAASGPSSVG